MSLDLSEEYEAVHAGARRGYTYAPDGSLLGSQVPTYQWIPTPSFGSAGQEAVDFSAKCGLIQDRWQGHILNGALGEEADDTWTCNTVGLIAGRQNGKGGIIEGRELAGLFLFGEDLILHSAHEFKTSGDAFLRMKGIVLSTPDLDRRLFKKSESKGEEGFIFRVKRFIATGLEVTRDVRLRYLTRTGSAGRGFTKANLVILDEAMILDHPPIAALLPIMATQRRWQVWYTGSAGDIRLRTQSVVLAKVRRRGYNREAKVMFAEFAAHLKHSKTCHDVHDERCGEVCHRPLCVLDHRADPVTWAKTNPAMGSPAYGGRIAESFFVGMMGEMAQWDFDREFLGVGEYPEPEGWAVVPRETWLALIDRQSKRSKGFSVGIETAWDGSTSSVAIASVRDDGMWHLELIENRAGTAWLVPYCKALKPKRPIGYFVRPGHTATELENERLKTVHRMTIPEMQAACGKAMQLMTETHRARHLGQPTLNNGLAALQKRDLGQGAYVWQIEDTTADVTPFVAVTRAIGGILIKGPKARGRAMLAAGGTPASSR